MSTLSTAARNAARNAINALLDAGSGSNPSMLIRDGSQTTLVEITLDGTKAIADAVAGVSTMNAPDGEASWSGYSVAPDASGTAADCVLRDTDDNIVETLSVGVTGSGEEVELGSLSIQTGVNVVFSAAPTATQRATYDPTP